MSQVRIQGLGKRYRVGSRAVTLGGALLGGTRAGDELWALREIDLEVRAGAVLGLVGPNGAGKTTLLRILARITAPTTGRVRLDGRVGSLLEVGTGFHPELTGRENVYLGGAVLGLTRSELRERFDAIVDFAGVGPYLDTPVKRYSSGMHVRLAFSVAAHLEAEILLVDEVLAVGDLEFQSRCLGRMDELAHEGRTVLFVSHNMAAVHDLCTRGVLLREGRIAHEGDVPSTITAYREALTAQVGASGVFEVAGPRLVAGFDGGPVRIEADLRALVPVFSPHLELYVMDARGDRVLSCRRAIEEDTRHVVLALPPTWLAPGTYALRGVLTWSDATGETHELPLPGQPVPVEGDPGWERPLLAPPATWTLR